MKKRNLLFGLFALALLLVGSVGVSVLAEKEEGKEGDEGKSAKVESLPAAVKATLAEAAPGAKVDKASIEEDDDEKEYEITVTTASGKKQEVVISEDGQLLEIEEEVTESALPAAVAKTLKDVLPGGKTEEIEKKLVVQYEIKKVVGDRTYEIVIDAKGEIVSIEAEDEDED